MLQCIYVMVVIIILNILIMSRKALLNFIKFGCNFDVALISITDYNQSHPHIKTVEHGGITQICQLKFDDVDDGEGNCITDLDAKTIADFVRSLTTEHLIVNCEAGISRSSGIAAAIMKAVNGDDMEVFNNYKYFPNMACYRKVLNQFMEIDEESLARKEEINLRVLKCYYDLD